MNRQNRFRFSKLALCVALAVGSLNAVPVMAQNTTSAVAGRVMAQDGKPAAGAEVKILHVESGSVSTTTTDAEGRYSARGLRVGGPYTITITKAGVVDKRENVFLTLAETATIDSKLGTTQVIEKIVVTSDRGASDKFSNTSMGAGTSLGRQELDAFASIQRNLQDYARNDPRVSQTDKERGEISVGGQNSRFNKITIDGVTINDTFGLEANNLPTLKQPISIDAIQSVQVNVSNYDVTQTGYTGGGINATTKSGTNEFHGQASFITRDNRGVGDRYNRTADTYFGAPDFKEKTYGVSLGGPIVKDTLFFYLNYEDFKSSRGFPDFGPVGSGGVQTAITPSAIASAQTLSTSRYNIDVGSIGATGANATVKDVLAKLDWNIGNGHKANLRYTKTEQQEPIYPGLFANSLSLSSHWYVQGKTIETVVGQWFADWTPNFSTEVKLSQRDYNSVPVNNSNLPQVSLSFTGALPPGAAAGVPTGTRALLFGTERSRQTNLLDTKTFDSYFGGNWSRGDHEVKFAADYSENKILNAFLQDTKGNYVFSCQNSSTTYTYSFGAINCATATAAQVEAAVLENYTRGRPTSYIVQVPARAGGSLDDGIARLTLKNTGLAVQDTWTINPNFTLMAGLRLDNPGLSERPLFNSAAAAPRVAGSVSGTTVVRQTGGFGLDNTNTVDGVELFQPRVGFNYTFDGKQQMQLRGGFGLFQGAAANVWFSNGFSNTGIATRVVGCGTQGFAPCTGVGGIFSANPAAQQTNFVGAAPAANVDYVQNGLGQPSVWKSNLAFDYELPWGGVVASLEYLYTKTETGIYYQHLNLGAPTRVGVDGREFYYTPTALNSNCWLSTGARVVSGTVNGVNCGLDNRARALSNAGFNNVLLASKTKQGGGNLITAGLSGRLFKQLNWSTYYTYTEAKEVSGLTSSVSNSNWASRSILNPNEEVTSNSAYLVKHRFNSTLNWSRAFIPGYKTTVGLSYEGRSGKPYSWTFSNDVNGDALAGNDLIYIPKAPGSGEVVFVGDTATNKTNENRFWEFVNGYKALRESTGGVVKRNETFATWTNNVDVRLSQEVPSFFKGHKAVFVLDLLNFGNMLNKKWGRIDEVPFSANGGQARSFVNFAGIDAQGRYVYAVNSRIDDLVTRQVKGESQWALQATFRYEF
jgi:Carboxypeptidase regulatory-like domain